MTLNVKRGIICALLALALVLAACGAAATPTPTSRTVTDDLGRQVVVPASPQRIVSWGPSNTEVLFALGLGDRVVGVDDFSDYPPEAKAKTKIGGFKPSLEAIVALNPDLVLAIQGAAVAQMEALGLRVVVLQPKDLEGVYADIALVGSITGTERKAAEIVKEMRGQVQKIADKVKGARRVKVFCEVDATNPAKPWTAGPGTFVNAFIVLAGGENIAARAAGPWVEFSLEEILAADPDVILLADLATPASVGQRAGWGSLRAAKEGKIYTINPDLTTRPGPRLAQGLEEIARALHPEAFR